MVSRYEEAKRVSLCNRASVDRQGSRGRAKGDRAEAREEAAETRSAAEGVEKYRPVSIRLHPSVLTWAKREAKRRGLGYQTVINEVLLKATA